MRTRQVRLEGGTLLLDGKPLWAKDAPQSLAISSFCVTDDGNSIATGDAGGQIRVWDVSAEPKILWFGNVIPGTVKHIAVSADRGMVFVLYDWGIWGPQPSFDVFTLNASKEYESTLRLHLRTFSKKARIEFGGSEVVLWYSVADDRWRLTEDGRNRW